MPTFRILLLSTPIDSKKHSSNKEYYYDCQGRQFTLRLLTKCLLSLCGGSINSAFFTLQDTVISEVIYYIEVSQELNKELESEIKK